MELSELNLIPKHGLVQTAKHAATMSGLHQSRVQTLAVHASSWCSNVTRWMATYAESSFAVSLT